MNSFPKNPLMNMGGIASFNFIPYHFISKLPAVKGKVISTPVLLLPGLSELKGYSTLEKLEFSENAKENDNGTYYQWVIQGFIPGDSAEIINLMEEMETAVHIVILRDNQNQLRLVGMGSPLVFISSFDSGSKPGEARGYKYSFAADSISRAPVYKLG